MAGKAHDGPMVLGYTTRPARMQVAMNMTMSREQSEMGILQAGPNNIVLSNLL